MSPERKSAFTSLSALVSVLAASTCCLPLGTFLAAAGTAGASAYLEGLSFWLMPLSAALLAFAFYQAYSKRNRCARRSTWSKAILWTSAVLVLALFLFPQYVALAIARMGSQ